MTTTTPEDIRLPAGEQPEVPPSGEDETTAVAAATEATDKVAASALQDILEEREEREPVDISEIRYFHVDDNGLVLWGTEEDLKEMLNMEKKLGQAQSVEEAFEELEKLAESNETLHLLLLDQRFFVTREQVEEGIGDMDRCSEILLKMIKDKGSAALKKMLEKTVIISLSGTADDQYIRDLQKISDRVIGGVLKGDQPRVVKEILKLLVDSGVARNNDTTLPLYE